MSTITIIIITVTSVVTMIIAALFKGEKIGKQSAEAKEGKANAQAIDTLAKVTVAKSDSNNGKLLDDDGFKRK